MKRKLTFRVYDDVFDDEKAPSKERYLETLQTIIAKEYPQFDVTVGTTTFTRGDWIDVEGVDDETSDIIQANLEELDEGLWDMLTSA